MALDPATLLEGPRGRGLCLAYALARGDGEAVQTLRWAILAREDRATSTVMYIGDPPPEPFAPPAVTTQQAASALESIALGEPTAASLREALAASVDHAMYWQPPYGSDRLAAEPGMQRALSRVAGVIAASPHARWWTSGVDLDDQWAVSWDAGALPQSDARAELTTWRAAAVADEVRLAAEHRADPHEWSGTWWSTPPSTLVRSTRGLGDDGPAGLWFVEDSLGWTSAIATPIAAQDARVFEIDGARAWAELCRRHPLDVTASRRHDWRNATGRAGEWAQPDWSSVAEEFGGVHVTVAGYLSAATRAIDVGDGRASVLAGWGPDETYWFGPTRVAGRAQTWEADESAPTRPWLRV